MLPADLKDFLIATTGASASFIGLLFVAISFVMNEKDDGSSQNQAKRILAESSYAALLNIFFISLVALIPNTTIGYVTLAMAFTGLANTLHFFRFGAGSSIHHSNKLLLAFSAEVYVAEAIYAILILFHGNHNNTNQYAFMTLILFLFGLGLTRAWELTGIRKRGDV